MSGRRPFSVLFVCTGNICRSALAHWYMQSELERRGISGVSIESCGISASTDLSVPPDIERLMAPFNVSFSRHIPKQPTRELITAADLILCMENDHVSVLRHYFPSAKERIHLLKEYLGQEGEVADPYGRSHAHFETSVLELRKLVDRLIDTLPVLQKPL